MWAPHHTERPPLSAGGGDSPPLLPACVFLPLFPPSSPERLIVKQFLGTNPLRFSLVAILPSWIYHLRSRKRQVMSPTMAPVPASPFTFFQLLRSQYLLLLLHVLGLLTGTVNVPTLLSSIHCRHFNTHILAQLFQTVSLSLFTLASIALLASSSSLSLRLEFLPGSRKGVREKKGSETLLQIFDFARLCLQIPQVGGSLLLGFTPRCRPAAGGPAPLPLTKLGFPSGSFQGVGGKRASKALSFLAVFSLIFLFLLVFAQTNALRDTEPHRRVFLYHSSTVDCQGYGFTRQLYRRSPQNGEIQKFTYAQVCARDLRRAQWPWNCHNATVDKLDPSLPTVCYCFTDTSSLGLSDEDFTTEIGFLNFVYGARIPPFHFLILACEGFAPSTPSLSASPGWLLPSTLCVCRRIEGTLPQIFGLSLAEVRFYHPFSCMNSCHGAFTKSLAPIDSQSASLLQTFCKNPGHEGSLLATLHLTSKNGGFYLPFSASNCAIRCHILLGESPSCAHMGFYQQLYHLSVDCGGSIPPTEFWSWISSTLSPDGFHPPLRSSNCMSECNLSLFTCHGVDLPSELLDLFARKFSAISCMACSWLVF